VWKTPKNLQRTANFWSAVYPQLKQQRRAGIGHVEVVAGDTPAELRRVVERLLKTELSALPAQFPLCRNPAMNAHPRQYAAKLVCNPSFVMKAIECDRYLTSRELRLSRIPVLTECLNISHRVLAFARDGPVRGGE
jgi:hypothetical protein